MWLLTQLGFFSVVQHRDNAAVVMIRARVKADLRELMKVTKVRSPIIKTPDADYPYRTIVHRSNLQLITHALCGSQLLDYSNFKDRVYSRDPERERIYHQVWALLRQLESLEARPSEAPSESASPPVKKATRRQRPR